MISCPFFAGAEDVAMNLLCLRALLGATEAHRVLQRAAYYTSVLYCVNNLFQVFFKIAKIQVNSC